MDKNKFEAFANEQIEQHKIPGTMIAIHKNGTDMYERGFGYRDGEQKLSVTSQTVFGIGSITKSMTCVAILQLQEAGKLSVHDSVLTYLLEFKTPDEAKTKQMTIHHFMTHSSGIPPLPTLFYANKNSMEMEGSIEQFKAMGMEWDDEQTAIDTNEDLFTFLAEQDYKLLGEPGQYMSYSNDAYALLGIIIERVSGRNYTEYMKEHLFNPLGMNNTFFSPEEIKDQNEVTLLYTTEPSGDEVEIAASSLWWDAPAMYAAGYVKSTADDMLRYGELFSNDHPTVLTQESINAMIFPHIQMQPGVYYGYGWMVSPDYYGTTLIEHSGGIKGVSASFAILPKKGIKGVCLTNIAGAPANPILMGGLNLASERDPNENYLQYEDYEWSNEERQLLQGNYVSKEGNNVEIKEQDEQLVVVSYGMELPARSVGPQQMTVQFHGQETYIEGIYIDQEIKRISFGGRQLIKR
ncbi:beta-lactamase family protein [Salicibibacter cibi]|uniref:Beta-lactamase family protein n=1 Tax=Salicibibacter cibi TaxID=2743001 RepID=A0A7T6ZAX1_9BACI|nr:serine hydrolase domain-containing protein [Salicibibacter cibi]QQK80153.1 beta-lactamase family protein [Salicibibacter cibi]